MSAVTFRKEISLAFTPCGETPSSVTLFGEGSPKWNAVIKCRGTGDHACNPEEIDYGTKRTLELPGMTIECDTDRDAWEECRRSAKQAGQEHYAAPAAINGTPISVSIDENADFIRGILEEAVSEAGSEYDSGIITVLINVLMGDGLDEPDTFDDCDRTLVDFSSSRKELKFDAEGQDDDGLWLAAEAYYAEDDHDHGAVKLKASRIMCITGSGVPAATGKTKTPMTRMMLRMRTRHCLQPRTKAMPTP